ncbi:hypothetical protein SUGI_0886240 [Cryptomeria japonica]|nr:hypothetical protein SUGI_0886240 [Cryptomeria japonica]
MGPTVRRRRRKKRKGNERGRTCSRSSLNIYNLPPHQITVFHHLKWIVEQGNDQPTVLDNLEIIDNGHDLAAFNSQPWGTGKSRGYDLTEYLQQLITARQNIRHRVLGGYRWEKGFNAVVPFK